jgi:hypothetical protein
LNRWLVRFDVRLAQEQYVSRRWDANDRARYLLRQDVHWPLSVDTLVWPSAFFSGIFKSPHFESYSTIEVDPAVDGGTQWLHLDAMRACYDSHRAQAPGGVFVGIELLTEKEKDGDILYYILPGDIQCGVWLEPTEPERLPEGSTLLGYDVADPSWISGLANCGYTEDDITDLGSRWAHRLNGFGLLASLEDAVEFRHVCDERVPEHAPFWIYALWRLPFD